MGHAFILLSALILGAKYGALTGAIGLSLADILALYHISTADFFVNFYWDWR
ncbi:MAG: ECF transporter S component [Phascolarctobacterium faecium]